MPKLKLSQKTIDSLKDDLAGHPSVTAAGTGFNWAGLIQVVVPIIENLVTQVLPLFVGAAPAPVVPAGTTLPSTAPVPKP
jgi:hypothetical protein